MALDNVHFVKAVEMLEGGVQEIYEMQKRRGSVRSCDLFCVRYIWMLM